MKLLLVLCAASLSAQVTATIAIDTTQSTPLNANFSGFNDEVVFPAEFYDYRLNNIAAQLSPGWVRYPSGSFSAAFDWQTGMMVPAWAAQFQGTTIASLIAEGVPWVDGKGGGSFVDGANRANFLGSKLIVCVNGFTDTPESAGQMAAFARANNIPVAVWELSNEPYIVPKFFPSGEDYVTKMKPYRDAIKAADPNAVVAIFFIDAGDTSPNPSWDESIAKYSNPYWDAVTYHQYPPPSTGAFSQWMADENAVLVSKTTSYVTNHLVPLNPPGMKFLISEFLPSSDGQGTGTSLTDGTLYGAIYAAEYVMRMSTLPSMLYVGMHALTGTRGVTAVNSHYADVQAAYQQGTTINTLTLSFGYYLTAQPLGLAILNGVLRNATQVNSTTVTGGSTVAATGVGQIPALYAQAYEGDLLSVVITNKSGTPNIVTINVDGNPVTGTLPVRLISGSDPTATNSATNQDNVALQASTATNPITVPPYSVVRADLSIPPPLIVVNSASYARGPVAPQEIASIFGPAIATQTAIASSPLPTVLAGTSVEIASQFAPLFAVTPGQANFLVPPGLSPGTTGLAVVYGMLSTPPELVTITNSAPGLYSANSDGAGVAAANAYTISSANQRTNQTVSTCTSSAPRSCLPTPLSLGGATDTLYVELYGTGIRNAASVECFVAGQSVPVLYAGPVPSYSGLDQVNISIPRTLAGTGDARVYLVADGVSSNGVALDFQ
jgi:uncharacterized protein (TIGR03437 family)